jgi:Spy/CpxP family protein refolding chaperone
MVSTARAPTVIDLIARAAYSDEPPVGIKQSPLTSENPIPDFNMSSSQRLELHQVEQAPSFEGTINLIREKYDSLKQLIQSPIFNQSEFEQIEKQLIQSYKTLTREHLDRLREDIDIPRARERRQEANNKPIQQFKNQITILENINNSLIDNIEKLEKNFSDLSLTAEETEFLRRTSLGKVFKLEPTSTGLFTEIIAEQKHRVLKNLAKIFSSSISSEDERMTKILQEKRFKGLYHQILDIYENHIPTKGEIPNPFEQRNFNDGLIEKEIYQSNYHDLDPSGKASLNRQIDTSTDPVEKNKLNLKRKDSFYAVGRRKALIKNLNALYKNDFRETVNIIRSYVENSFKNESKINHRELMPDGAIGPRDLAVLGFSNAALREKHVHALGLRFTIGSINETRVSIAAQFLNQLLETGGITNYLKIKKSQYQQIGLEIDKDPNFNKNFSIERIIHFSPRGPFDISGSDIGFLIKEKKGKVKTRPQEENSESYSYKFIRIQVKSSERAAAKSMGSKYPDIHAISGTQHKLNPKTRIPLGDRVTSLYTSGEELTYPYTESKKLIKRTIDPDLPLKLLTGINKDRQRNFLTIEEEQYQELEKLFNDETLFKNQGKNTVPVNDTAEIQLMNALAAQGFLSSLCLAYQKYPYTLQQKLIGELPRHFAKASALSNQIPIEYFSSEVDKLVNGLAPRLNFSSSIEVPKGFKSNLFNSMNEQKIEMSYLKPILYKALREYQTQANWSAIDLSKILKPYASEAREQKKILGHRLGGVKKLLKKYLSKMLETTNPQLTQTDRQSVLKILINHKIAFNPAFFHRISSPEIKTKEDILSCLDEFPKNFKTKFDIAPIDLSKEYMRKQLELKHSNKHIIAFEQTTQGSLNQASA